MIKREGIDMGKVEDMRVIDQGREMTWSGNLKKKNKKQKNELVQIKAMEVGCPNVCP
jgi:hypothetical protein